MRAVIITGFVLAVSAGAALAQGSGPQASGPQASGPATQTEMRELIEATKAAAKAARDNIDYARVVPDILTQILAKLDKIETKLDKIETAAKRDDSGRKAPTRR